MHHKEFVSVPYTPCCCFFPISLPSLTPSSFICKGFVSIFSFYSFLSHFPPSSSPAPFFFFLSF